MTPAHHPLGVHLSTCSGPDNCPEFASILSMTPTEHSVWLLQDRARIARLRSASTRTRQLRVSQQEDFTPPNSYTAAIARRREADETPARRAARERAASARQLRVSKLDTPLTDDKATLIRAIEARLHRVSPGFMRIIDVDLEQRTGTYEEYVDGATKTSKFTFELDGVVGVVLKTAEDFTPVNSYTLAIAKRREADETPASSRFPERYARERTLALNAEYAATTQQAAQSPAPPLTAAELAAFAPPDPYRAALDKMKEGSK